LGDPDKRALYDKYGSKGSPSNQNDLLNMFFGGQGGRQAAQKKQMAKVKPTKKGLEITL
jgi:DnaJ-class molecular chaperone